MTRGQAQVAGTTVPEVHGHSKPLDPNLKPEKDTTLKKHVFTPSVNPAISKGISTTSGPQISIPRAIPPVQLPTKYNPPISQQIPQTPRETPQISQNRVAAGSSGSFTPVGGGPTPLKGEITPAAWDLNPHTFQKFLHIPPHNPLEQNLSLEEWILMCPNLTWMMVHRDLHLSLCQVMI